IRDLKSDSDAFRRAKQDFVDAFTSPSYKGSEYKEGPELTGEIMKDLRDIALDAENSSALRRAARRVVLRHKQVGMAMGRQELRHNGAEYEQIFENLYAHLKKIRPEILPAGIKNLKSLTPQAQGSFLHHLMKEHKESMRGWFLAANP